mmetsp:Transcript_34797/g.63691  ORF Transcript_34797/g.63691 Transcript_34797/m.63691 type:complete len:293 (-) Transcript_34797:31-909(-)
MGTISCICCAKDGLGLCLGLRLGLFTCSVGLSGFGTARTAPGEPDEDGDAGDSGTCKRLLSLGGRARHASSALCFPIGDDGSGRDFSFSCFSSCACFLSTVRSIVFRFRGVVLPPVDRLSPSIAAGPPAALRSTVLRALLNMTGASALGDTGRLRDCLVVRGGRLGLAEGPGGAMSSVSTGASRAELLLRGVLRGVPVLLMSSLVAPSFWAATNSARSVLLVFDASAPPASPPAGSLPGPAPAASSMLPASEGRFRRKLSRRPLRKCCESLLPRDAQSCSSMSSREDLWLGA